MTTLGLAVLFALCGHDSHWVRDRAEARLTALRPARNVWRSSVSVSGADPDPEVRHRAGRVARRLLPLVVDDLLPAGAWAWPDIDHARRWVDLGVIARPDYVWRYCPAHPGWPFPAYRRAFRVAVTDYLTAGGSWATAREMVADALAVERGHPHYGELYATPTRAAVLSLARHAPECLGR